MPIVISQALVLSELVDGGADAPLIGWQNFVTSTNVSADEEDADYPASNLGNPSTALRWQAETTGEQYIEFTLSGTDAVDYVGIARHNLGSGQVTVSVEISDGDSPANWTEVAPEFIPARDDALVIRFDEEQPPAIRIRLQPGSVVPFMAVVYVGKLLRLPRGVQPGLVPTIWAASDDVVAAESEAGDYLGAIVLRESLQTSVQVMWLDYTWWLTNMPGFIAHARQRQPFFFAWLPASYPNDVGYAWTQNDIRPEAHNMRTGYKVHVTLDLKAVAA